MMWAEVIRSLLAAAYLTVAVRAYLDLRHCRRWKERYVTKLIGAVASGWTLYWGYTLVAFWGAAGSSHQFITHAGRTWHVPTVATLLIVQYLMKKVR